MKFGSLCSGIEAASLAWESLGLTPAWVAEVEPFCNAVLSHRWPGVPNLGDVRAADFSDRALRIGPIDVLVGGTPCQGFSVAGRRGGLADGRSHLAFDFLAAVERLRPEWVVWENVPGVLATNGGRDFGAFLDEMGRIGYGWSYRLLDSRYFGVPQSRRRLYLVGRPRGRSGRGVLLDPVGLREGPLAGGTAGASPRPDPRGVAPRGRLGDSVAAVAFTERGRAGGSRTEWRDGVAYCLSNPGKGGRSTNRQVAVRTTDGRGVHSYRVRRYTPRECERLQGMPDDHTLVPYRGTMAKDTERYRAIGNSMTVPVLRWIGRGILDVARGEAGSRRDFVSA